MKHEYKSFRSSGVAFSPEENENHEAPNRSLSSSKVMGDGRGDKNAYRGYWGDVVVGPYITHGLETDNKELTKLVNGRPSNSSEMIAKYNINELLTKIHAGSSESSEELETKLVKKRETYSSTGFENSSVVFLSPSSFDEIAESSEFKSKFDVISLSVSHCQNLSHSIVKNCLKPESHIFAETPQFITDLNKDQLASTLQIIKQLAKDSQLSEIEDESLKGLFVFSN
jgi:dynein assembly factor 3